jgi:hypothetical protein
MTGFWEFLEHVSDIRGEKKRGLQVFYYSNWVYEVHINVSTAW